MTSRDFAYWLQGFFEISQCTEINEKQTQIIKNHLNMVFKHEIDPSHGNADHQKILSDLHRGIAGSGGGTGVPINPLGPGIINC